MSKRLQVIISDGLDEKLADYAERYGISKSSIVCFVLGQWMDQNQRAIKTIFGTGEDDGLIKKLFNEMVKQSIEHPEEEK